MNDDEKTKVLNKVKDVEKEKIFKQYKLPIRKKSEIFRKIRKLRSHKRNIFFFLTIV